MKTAFLFDFDGTITLKDTCEIVLRRFAKGDWEKYDQMMDQGKISLEACMKEQFGLVNEGPSEILAFLDEVVEGRKGFLALVSELEKTECEFAIVSAGLDFIIAHYLSFLGMSDRIEVISGRTRFDEYLHFEFPPIQNVSAVDFKQDAVLEFKKKFQTVFFIGDGASDYNAARSCDFVFAVRSSRLEKYCVQNKIPHEAFDDFTQLIVSMAKYI